MKEEFFRSKLKMVALSLFAFLMCMFRNQGIYMLVLLLPFAVIAWKRYRLKMALILLIPIIIIIPVFLGIILNVKRGEK